MTANDWPWGAGWSLVSGNHMPTIDLGRPDEPAAGHWKLCVRMFKITKKLEDREREWLVMLNIRFKKYILLFISERKGEGK